jgi:hypothetical protein
MQKYGEHFKIPSTSTQASTKEASKIELITKCLLENIDYKTVINNSLGSVGDLSSKKVTPMKSQHTAHSSPVPTGKKP